MENRQHLWPVNFAVLIIAVFLCLVSVGIAAAEVRTINVTGEYWMGDNDTRTDAKRLALLDAKRIALEQAGTYIESITQVKNFDLSNEEIRAYTAGIVEVVEQATRDTMEGATHIIRVDITAKIDSDVVARQIDAVRKNEPAKAELLKLRAQMDQLKKEVESRSRELMTIQSKTEAEIIANQRRKVLTRMDVEALLRQAVLIRVHLPEVPPGGKDSTRLAELGRARNLIARAIALDPSSPNAHALMGSHFEEERNIEGAIREYRIALSLEPDNSDRYIDLGDALGRSGDLEAAIAAYREAVRVGRDEDGRLRAYYGLGDVLAKHGLLAESIAAYREAVRVGQDAGSRLRARDHGYLFLAYMVLGDKLRAVGDIDGAVEEYRRAIRTWPNAPDLRIRLGYGLWQKKDLKGAMSEFHTAMRLNPNDVWAHSGLARALEDSGDHEGALEEYRAALRLKPDEERYSDLAASFARRDDLKGASEIYREAISHNDPGVSCTWHLVLSEILEKIGGVERVVGEYGGMARQRPDDPMVYYVLGQAFEKNGRKSEAVREFRKYLKLAPTEEGIHNCYTDNYTWIVKSVLRRLGE